MLDHTTYRCAKPGHEHESAASCRTCRSDRLAAAAPDGDYALTTTPAQAATNARGAGLVLAALAAAPTPAWRHALRTERTTP